MKKKLSLAGFSLVAMGLFMGSCVSKKKYMEAQTSAAERYRTDSTEWANRSNTQQQNITSLEQKNASYQKEVDSLKTTSADYQKKWESLQTTYTQQNTSTEQITQQVHTAIDEYVEASNVESSNGKVYVNLPEKMLFSSGSSSTLSAKGKQALDKLADVLAGNENIDVDIIATAAYYNDSAMGGVSEPTDKTGVSPATTKTKEQPAKKTQPTVKKSAPKAKASTASTAKKSSDRPTSFKSTPKKKPKSTAPSWNLNVARSTAIGRELTNNGLPKARIVVTKQGGKGVVTNEWASANRGYQVVISPKMDSYYQTMQGQSSTSMK
jgi:hypothetical protein